MTDADLDSFHDSFRQLAATYRLRLKVDDMNALAANYFGVLRSYPLAAVLAAGTACLSKYRTFPKVVDWVDAITRNEVGAPPDVRIMSMVEAAEYQRAERQHWDDDPCDCLLCRAAGIVRRLRFVPDVTDDGRDEKAFCPPKNRIVVAGHWAHGAELVRWYDARDHFFGLAGPVGINTTVFRRFGFVYTPPSTTVREPGEEG